MPPTLEDAVRTTLEPLFSDLTQIMDDALSDWRSSHFFITMQDPKVRATCIWNQFLYRAKAHFEGHETVSVETIGYWAGLYVENNYFIRMKKAGPGLLSRNYPTKSALAFNDAEVDLFDGITRLELIYDLDKLGIKISHLVIAQRDKNRILWAIDLLNLADSSGQRVIPMPTQPSNPQAGTPAARVIKPKKQNIAIIEKSGTNDAT